MRTPTKATAHLQSPKPSTPRTESRFMPPMGPCTALLVIATLTLGVVSGCSSSRHLRAELAPMNFKAPAVKAKVLKHNRFEGDKVGNLTEAHMREILAAPVFLEKDARFGIVRVAGRYKVDADVPTHTITDLLRQELQATGLLDDVTEVTTDWPASSGIPGLRELAARYRCEYLVLYRHRFVDRSWNNGWTVMALTIVGAFFAPMHSIETAGVLEVTLFDVKTGTLLFTSYERVHNVSEENIYQNDRKRADMKTALMGTAAEKLSERLVGHTRRLASLRPKTTVPVASRRSTAVQTNNSTGQEADTTP